MSVILLQTKADMVFLSACCAVLLLAVKTMMIRGAALPTPIAVFKYLSAAALVRNCPALHGRVVGSVAE